MILDAAAKQRTPIDAIMRLSWAAVGSKDYNARDIVAVALAALGAHVRHRSLARGLRRLGENRQLPLGRTRQDGELHP